MICKCGWKYKHEKKCPKCGKSNRYQTGIGMPNRDGMADASTLYGVPKRRQKSVKRVSQRRRDRLDQTGGERAMFERIWRIRKHQCQNKDCKKKLNHEARAHYFAHIHGKGARPDLRTDLRNVVLLCEGCEYKSQNSGWRSINLPEPYKTMAEQPPPFDPT